jgi:twitching motility protein PilT
MDGLIKAKLLEDLEAIVASNQTITDLIVQPGQPISAFMPEGWVRAGEPISREHITEAAAEMIGVRDVFETLQGEGAINQEHTFAGRRVRVDIATAFNPNGGVGIELCIRCYPARLPEFKTMPLPPSVLELLTSLRSGLILVAGKANSGKTTLIASLLDAINRSRAAHLITLEDPIEYVLEPKLGVISHRQIQVHVPSFADGVKQSLRQRPDVLMIGEIRDAETATTALSIAQSSLVIASTHATHTVPALQRINQLAVGQSATFAEALRAVISLALLPDTDKKAWVQVAEYASGESQHVRKAIETNSDKEYGALREAFRLRPEGARGSADTAQLARDTSQLRSMNLALARLVGEKRIDPEVARGVSPDPANLMELLLRVPRPA